MKTPTQEQFKVVIDNLVKANKMAKGLAKVQMMEGDVDKEKNLCGTPACHGGWYCIANGINDVYSFGAEKMAKHLGFTDSYTLQVWAQEHPEIWGNEYGYKMFSDGSAFGDGNQTDETITDLSQIIEHWKGVKKRAYIHSK